MSNPTYIYLIRHGQTPWNAEKRIQGRADIPLSDKGKADSLEAAAFFKTQMTPIDACYSSPLTRAKETANIYAHVIDLPPYQIYDGIIERAFGHFDGSLIKDSLQAIWHYTGDDPDFESEEALHERALKALAFIHKEHPNQTIACFTHSQIIKGGLTAINPQISIWLAQPNNSYALFKVEDDENNNITYTIIKYNCFKDNPNGDTIPE